MLSALTGGNEELMKNWNTSIRLQFGFLIKHEHTGDQLVLRLGQVQIGGTSTYREFDISAYLTPDLFSGYVQLSEMERVEFKASFVGESQEAVLFPAPIQLRQPIRGRVGDAAYTTERIEATQKLMAQVNQYWALSGHLREVMDISRSAENNAGENLADLFLQRERIRKGMLLLKETAGLDFMQKADKDPASLWNIFPDLQRMLVRYNTLLSNASQTTEVSEEMIRMVANLYRKDMTMRLKKMFSADFRDHELLHKTIRLMPDSALYSATNSIRAANNAENLTEILAQEVMALGDSLIGADDFANALMFFEDAQKVYHELGVTQAESGARAKAETARLGLLRSYLRIAAKALESGNETLAQQYQQKSAAFVQRYPQNGLVNRIASESDELIKTYLRKANLLLDQKQYLQAINILEEVSGIARAYYNLHHQEQINQALFIAYRQVYLELVDEAASYLAAGELTEAEIRLNYALNYQRDHSLYLKTSTETIALQNQISLFRQNQSNVQPGLFQNSQNASSADTYDAEQKILSLLQDAMLKVWANELEAAWTLFEQADAMAKSGHLEKKKTVAQAFQQLDQRMVERICLNHRFEVEELTNKAKLMIASKEFSLLEQTLMQAVKLQTENQGCALNVDEARHMLDEFADLIRYINDYQQLTDVLYTSGLVALIPHYTFFDTQVAAYQLERFGVKHPYLHDFVRTQNNGNMTLQTLAYFVERMDTLEVAKYIAMLHSQDFSVAQSLELQEKAASVLAVSDHSRQITDAEMRCFGLVGDDDRFTVFRKTYLRSFKYLAKQRKKELKEN